MATATKTPTETPATNGTAPHSAQETEDLDLSSLPEPTRKANAAVVERTAAIDRALTSLVPGKARKFAREPKDTPRGLKLRLSKRVTKLGLTGKVVIESTVFNGEEIVYAKLA